MRPRTPSSADWSGAGGGGRRRGEGRLCGDPPDEPREVDGRRQVVPVAAEMHPGEDDLLEPDRSEALDLREDRARRKAPARPARHRDDAEGAEEVAPLLHFQERPRLAVEAPRS